MRSVLALVVVAAAIAVFLAIDSTGARSPTARDSATVTNECPRGGKAVSRVCRWYLAKSPFNTQIPTGAPADPASALMVQRMTESLGSFFISVKRWSVPVYYAGTNTKRYNVRMTESALTAYQVPIPAGARPSAPFPPEETDGAMVVFDPTRGCEYDFWEASKQPDGSWKARGVSRIETNSGGIYRRGASARGSGFALGAGLIRPEEVEAGAIKHALVFSLPSDDVKGGGPVRPASESDGASTLDGAIPEGARVQLDPSFDVSTLGHRWQRTIARALQRYGMYLSDRGGGGVGLVAQNPQSYAHNPYPWGNQDYAYLPSELISRLRVLQLPPQFTPGISIVRSRCGVIR
jgi:hypothetical protein